ncbi:MAG: Gfo/Idh/MocA family oxidoreductase [Thermodesulfobacteriota bacterium]
MKKIRVGVVGVGHLGKFHVEKYARMAGVELVGIADTNRERRESIARKYRIPGYEDHRPLLSRIEAVSIAVPTSEHTCVTRDFLEHGTDVLVEKPISVSLTEAEELITLADLHQRVLQVGHLERFNPVYLKAKPLIRHPLFFESQRLSPFKARSLDVDVVLDLMIHDLDLILDLVPFPVREVHGVGVPVVSPRADIANVRVQFQNGCVANITASRISQKERRQMRIFQPAGYLALDFVEKAFSQVRLEKPEEGLASGPRFVSASEKPASGDALEKELQSFIEAVRTRCRPEVCGEDGRKALALALRINREIEKNLQLAKESHGAADFFKSLQGPHPR